MAKTPVLGTGLSGLVGSRIVELLGNEFEFTNLDLTHGVDILNIETVRQAVQASSATTVLHFAGFTDVNAAHEQYGDTNGSCYQVNVVGTRNIAQVCKEEGKHLVHISTGYVFDGTKSEPYTEEDTVNPTDWYSITKTEAEDVVRELTPEATILRINFPYRTDEFPKRDIWHKVADALLAGKTGPFFADHLFTLTPIEWLAPVIRWSILRQPAGIFHATTDKVYSDYTLAEEVKKSLGITAELSQGSLSEYNKTAPRKYQVSLILSNKKLVEAMAAQPA